MGFIEYIGEATLRILSKLYQLFLDLLIEIAKQSRRVNFYPYFEKRGIDYRDYMVLKAQMATLVFLFISVLFVFGFLGGKFYAFLFLLLGGYSLYIIPRLKEHFTRDYNAYRDFFLGYLGIAVLLVVIKTAKPAFNPFFPNLHLVIISILYIVLFSYFFKSKYGRDYTLGRVIEGGSIARVKLNYDICASVKPCVVSLSNEAKVKEGDMVKVMVEKSAFNLRGKKAVRIMGIEDVSS